MATQIEISKRVIIDVTFLSINSMAFDVKRLSLQKGQKVKLQLNTSPDACLQWFSNHDQVLDIDEHNNYALVKATKTGNATIEIQRNGVTVRSIKIEVTPAPANKVELVFSTPVHK